MGGPRLADRSPGAKLFVKTGAQVGKADTQVEQQLGQSGSYWRVEMLEAWSTGQNGLPGWA
jgi:hypothetical protein